MNDPNTRDKLLSDLLQDESFAAFNAEARDKALRSFKRHHRVVRARPFMAMAVLALLAVPWLLVEHRRPPNVPPQARSAPALAPANREEQFFISDQQLLSYFPPGSCALVQTEQKTLLVFWDAELKKRLCR